MNLLNRINFPSDLKTLSVSDLGVLADEIRQTLIHRVNETGGHMSPNLGFIEPTIALHYVFNSPKDKFVFDISHQCYTHKILTGRKDGFINEENYYKYSGFTAPNESEHDLFQIGHTSTSVTLATGLAKARDIKGDKENVIAIIGDGSLTGGEAFEGLNNAAVLNSNFIIVVNDNNMSIAENQGGLSRHLANLRDTQGKAENNLFKALGFEYFYVENGNNISDLINVFEKVKDSKSPLVVHLHTLKGKGLKESEENKEKFHYVMPHVLDVEDDGMTSSPDYSSITREHIWNKIENGEKIVVVTPATPSIIGLTPDIREKFGANYVDVGIAEQHAIGFISGLAKNGVKGVLCVASSFIQRGYDQISQDLALNNSPAVILVFGGGISDSDATHLGVFDIPLISNIPNLIYLAPTNKEECLSMLDYALENKTNSIVIKIPNAELISVGITDETDYSKAKFKVVEHGKDVAIIGVGSMFELAKELKSKLKGQNIDATLINPCFISSLDKGLLDDLNREHKLVVTVEDGIVDGGFGQKIASYYGSSNMRVLNYGAEKEFTDMVDLDEIYECCRLKSDLIVEDIFNIIG
ncbi:MAG: 1-deoxy-D-xylulose-5-phosphate synthase [Rickettsiales bacterium]|jgi:1-deoxy-D-xylulose-5-phosphate synthase|nr:1-deoxy-D-xylulose-5-phosphate synthase [Rickettsiales bacterium]